MTGAAPPVPLPAWCRLVRADNPGPMTLDGTNTWVLSADDGVVVVDPGPLLEEHLRRVAAIGPVLLTVLTHGHRDHAEGAHRFAELTGSPVVARDPRLCVGDATLPSDGGKLDVSGLDVRVLSTPGHTRDSVSLLVEDRARPAVLTGDTVLGRGTTVVAYPDGRLGPYLDSLARLRDVGPRLLLPGHGPVREDAAAVVEAYLTHRHRRLDAVRAAVTAGAATVGEVVQVVYADVPREVWPAAERTVRAQLEYLGVDPG
jgi:glyoxylase-like metal-dependent hydrolase (beta-lactamase superfamily II)